MTAKYVASRLETITHQFGHSRTIIVIAHSNGTRATRIAMDMRLKPKKKWPKFKIDNLILLGCPIKCNYKWDRHRETAVHNFISTNDWVVWAAGFYGMGSAGKYGFNNKAPNLSQSFVRWGHSGFIYHYEKIEQVIRDIILWQPLFK